MQGISSAYKYFIHRSLTLLDIPKKKSVVLRMKNVF